MTLSLWQGVVSIAVMYQCVSWVFHIFTRKLNGRGMCDNNVYFNSIFHYFLFTCRVKFESMVTDGVCGEIGRLLLVL